MAKYVKHYVALFLFYILKHLMVSTNCELECTCSNHTMFTITHYNFNNKNKPYVCYGSL